MHLTIDVYIQKVGSQYKAAEESPIQGLEPARANTPVEAFHKYVIQAKDHIKTTEAKPILNDFKFVMHLK